MRARSRKPPPRPHSTDRRTTSPSFATAFERRRNIVVDGVAKIPALSLDPPGGAFYTFIGCADVIGSITPDGEHDRPTMSPSPEYLLDDGFVAAVPGSAYSLSPFIRLSTATSDENLETG